MYPLSFSSASIMAEYTFSPAQRFPHHITSKLMPKSCSCLFHAGNQEVITPLWVSGMAGEVV